MHSQRDGGLTESHVDNKNSSAIESSEIRGKVCIQKFRQWTKLGKIQVQRREHGKSLMGENVYLFVCLYFLCAYGSW